MVRYSARVCCQADCMEIGEKLTLQICRGTFSETEGVLDAAAFVLVPLLGGKIRMFFGRARWAKRCCVSTAPFLLQQYHLYTSLLVYVYPSLNGVLMCFLCISYMVYHAAQGASPCSFQDCDASGANKQARQRRCRTRWCRTSVLAGSRGSQQGQSSEQYCEAKAQGKSGEMGRADTQGVLSFCAECEYLRSSIKHYYNDLNSWRYNFRPYTPFGLPS